MGRDGSTAEQALARIGSQIPVTAKAALADFVIENDSSVESALARADRVLSDVCRKLGIDPKRYGFD
jgi:dephospho-CoA kinase